MLLFGPTVTRRWGRIGSRRPQTLSKNYETWEEAKREVVGAMLAGSIVRDVAP